MSMLEDTNHYLEHRALGEYADKGYRLVRYPDGTLELQYKDTSVAAFPICGTPGEDIHKACQRHEQRLMAEVTQ